MLSWFSDVDPGITLLVLVSSVLTAFGLKQVKWTVSEKGIPTIGLLFLIPVVITGLIDRTSLTLSLSCGMVAVLGFLDDLLSLSVWVRLVVQALVALAFCYWGWHNAQPLWYALCLVAGMNIFNFMDGINGMLGIYVTGSIVALSAVLGFYDLSADPGLWLMAITLIVFLTGNARPSAKWLAGDAGSLLLGFWMTYQVLNGFAGKGGVPIVPLLVFFSVFITDAGLTILFRLTRNQNILIRHTLHLYQRLFRKFPHKQVFIALAYTLFQWMSILLAVYFFMTPLIAILLIIMSAGIWVFQQSRLDTFKLLK